MNYKFVRLLLDLIEGKMYSKGHLIISKMSCKLYNSIMNYKLYNFGYIIGILKFKLGDNRFVDNLIHRHYHRDNNQQRMKNKLKENYYMHSMEKCIEHIYFHKDNKEVYMKLHK